MSDKDKLAEYYDTHDISADMEAEEWSRHEGKLPETAMSGFNTRLPTAVLNDVRAIARARGLATGAWIREVIGVAVARQKGGRHGAHVSPACRRRGIVAPPGLLTSSPTDDPAPDRAVSAAAVAVR
jgi:hypothetical protein